MEFKFMNSNNLIGIILSIVCIIHCLAFPFIVLFIGIDTVTNFISPDLMIHEVLFILVFFIYINVFLKNFRNNKNLNLGIIASIGILSLFLGLFQERNMEILLTVFGALLMIIAHYKNYKSERII